MSVPEIRNKDSIVISGKLAIAGATRNPGKPKKPGFPPARE